MMTYKQFRDGVGGEFVRREFGVDLTGTGSWYELRHYILESRGGEDRWEAWCEARRHRFGTMSTGERALYLAVLVAADYRWLADELAHEGGRSFLDLAEYVRGGDFGAAVGACIAGIERQ